MKKHVKKIQSISFRMRLMIIVIALFMAVGTYLLIQAQAAAASIYISPASAGKYVGDSFSVQVRVNTTSNVNAAFIQMNYNANGLQVTGMGGGSEFPNQLEAPQHTISGNTGTIKMKRTRNVSGTGDLHYATVTFKTKAAGTYGLTPLSSSELFDYGGPTPRVSYTIGSGRYSVISRPTPAPTPAPATPAPTSAPTPASPKLSISNFAITEVGYRTATVSWDTSKPASSKANYGYSINDLPNEAKTDGNATNHKLVLTGDAMRAGNTYVVRVTSDDGTGPVTFDGEFSTRGVDILVKVTDLQQQPAAGAEVTVGTKTAITDDDGMAKMIVQEGALLFGAKKDALSGDSLEEILVPAADNIPLQTVSVVLGVSATSGKTNAEGSKLNLLWIVLPLVIGGAGLVTAAVFIRRRRQLPGHRAPSVAIISDPVSEQPVRHASLPELVSQDLKAKNKKPPQSVEEPEDMFSVLDNPAPPPAQPPPIQLPDTKNPSNSDDTHRSSRY